MYVCAHLTQTFILGIGDRLLELVLQVLEVVILLFLIYHFNIRSSSIYLLWLLALINFLDYFELESVFLIRLDKSIQWSLVFFHGYLKYPLTVLI